jgi:hypothetical protein
MSHEEIRAVSSLTTFKQLHFGLRTSKHRQLKIILE